MKEYEFEIQNCIAVKVSGADADEARINLIEHLNDYSDQMIDDCVIGNGVEV